MEFVTRKIGPLPAWAWVALAFVAFIAFRWWQNRQGGGGGQSNQLPAGLSPVGGALGGFSTPVSDGTGQTAPSGTSGSATPPLSRLGGSRGGLSGGVGSAPASSLFALFQRWQAYTGGTPEQFWQLIQRNGHAGPVAGGIKQPPAQTYPGAFPVPTTTQPVLHQYPNSIEVARQVTTPTAIRPAAQTYPIAGSGRL